MSQHIPEKAKRTSQIRMACIACVGLVILSVSLAHAGDNKACGLLRPAEIESALGTKVTSWNSSPLPETMPGSAGNNNAEMCSASTSNATLLLRLAKKTGATGREAKGIAIARQMGAKVEVKTSGPITCSSMIPPGNLAQYGFNTTCSVTKGEQVAAIEVTVKSEKEMVPMDKLRPLAETMATRF